MNRWGGRLAWLIAGAAIATAFLLWRARHDQPPDLRQAARRGEVAVALQAQGPDSAQVTVTRAGSGRGRLQFLLPAGVVIASRDGSSQALMTAAPVAVQLQDGVSSAQLQVETYCLQPLKPAPTLETPVSFADDDGVVVDDTRLQEARKLVECLKPDFGSHGERQLAVWLVGQGYLEKPFSEVSDTVHARLRGQAIAEMQAKLDREFAEEFRKRVSGATDDEVQAQRARFTPDYIASRLGPRIDAASDRFLKGFLGAKPLLQRCGYTPDKLAFFSSSAGRSP